MLNQERNLKRTSLAKGKKGTYKQTNEQQQAKTERKEQHVITVNDNSSSDETKILVDNYYCYF